MRQPDAVGVALIAALVPVLIFAVSTLITAVNHRAEGRRADWQRIEALIAILTNLGSKTGLWSQMLAVEELADFPRHRAAISRIATAARDGFLAKNADPALVLQLGELIARTSGQDHVRLRSTSRKRVPGAHT